jgi:hypothetical protein
VILRFGSPVSCGRKQTWQLFQSCSRMLTPGARAVFDNEWPSEPITQPLTDQAGCDVDSTARGKSDNEAHRPRRIGLRKSKARNGRHRSSAGGEVWDVSTMKKFHSSLSVA